MGIVTPTLAVDLGTRRLVAAVVTDEGAWPVPDPASGELAWPCSIHWDGQRVCVGALAERLRRQDASGYATGLKPGLGTDAPVLLGARSFRPVEQVMELLAGVRAAAQRSHGPIARAVLTIPASYTAGDPRRARL